MKTLQRGTRGFTLIEMVITLALLGVLASIAAPLAELTLQRRNERELRESLREIRTAIDRYKAAADLGLIAQPLGASGYPPNLLVLVQGVPNQQSPKGDMLYFLRQVPRDPFAPPEWAADQTWALRSYTSSPDAPSAGADVFDVHSTHPGTGLNGRPYRQW